MSTSSWRTTGAHCARRPASIPRSHPKSDPRAGLRLRRPNPRDRDARVPVLGRDLPGAREGSDAIVCREDVERAKPAPDLYMRACELIDVAPDDALAIEDSPNGVASAQAAGLRVVAVPNELTSGLDLTRAECRLGSCSELALADFARSFSLAPLPER